MKRPLGTSAQSIDGASLLLVDLQTEEGITGRTYAFCYLPSIARSLLPVVAASRCWLEYVDWAVPILQEPIRIVNGMAIVPNRPGNGVLWDEAAVAKFRLD